MELPLEIGSLRIKVIWSERGIRVGRHLLFLLPYDVLFRFIKKLYDVLREGADALLYESSLESGREFWKGVFKLAKLASVGEIEVLNRLTEFMGFFKVYDLSVTQEEVRVALKVQPVESRYEAIRERIIKHVVTGFLTGFLEGLTGKEVTFYELKSPEREVYELKFKLR
ncbi:MAG: hypothetical protein B6U69_03755 [Thermofilum sp. ex4484_15]|nr:MAG: hypothetical protein B6U69_03755 [Thermofilum sp. ex4484_15]